MPRKMWNQIVYQFQTLAVARLKFWKTDKHFHPTFYDRCNYLFLLGFTFYDIRDYRTLLVAFTWDATDIWHSLVQSVAWWRHRWKYFPRYWPFVRGVHRSPVNSPRKGQWPGALVFSFIGPWINGWVNNRKAGDLRRHRAHYGVNVMRHWQGSRMVSQPLVTWLVFSQKYSNTNKIGHGALWSYRIFGNLIAKLPRIKSRRI